MGGDIITCRRPKGVRAGASEDRRRLQLGARSDGRSGDHEGRRHRRPRKRQRHQDHATGRRQEQGNRASSRPTLCNRTTRSSCRNVVSDVRLCRLVRADRRLRMRPLLPGGWMRRWRTAGPMAAALDLAGRPRAARASPARDHRSRARRRAADGDAPTAAISWSSTARSTTIASCARELEARGERFSTPSDTEVLLRLSRATARGARARARHVRAGALGCARAVAASGPRSLRHQAALRRGAAGTIAFSLGDRRAAARRARRPQTSPAGVLAFLSWGSVPLAADVAARRRGAGARHAGAGGRSDGRDERGEFADTRAPMCPDARPDASRSRAARSWPALPCATAWRRTSSPTCLWACSSRAASTPAPSSPPPSSAGATNLQTFTVGFDDRRWAIGSAACASRRAARSAPRITS